MVAAERKRGKWKSGSLVSSHAETGTASVDCSYWLHFYWFFLLSTLNGMHSDLCCTLHRTRFIFCRAVIIHFIKSIFLPWQGLSFFLSLNSVVWQPPHPPPPQHTHTHTYTHAQFLFLFCSQHIVKWRRWKTVEQQKKKPMLKGRNKNLAPFLSLALTELTLQKQDWRRSLKKLSAWAVLTVAWQTTTPKTKHRSNIMHPKKFMVTHDNLSFSFIF